MPFYKKLFNNKPLNHSLLTYLDFLVLSVIFFGYFSYVSILGYFSTPVLDPISASSFSSSANWISIATELVLLLIAIFYLVWRQFDFKKLDFGVHKMTLPLALALVVIGALTTDLVLYGGYWLLSGQNPFVGFGETLPSSLFAHINISLLAFALVNGFFEEVFFMGLAFAVSPKYRPYALITSVFVRFIFHIYQGLSSAFAIATVGVVFIAIRHILLKRHIKSITPFILAHAVFDVFGASIVPFLFI